jgi:hypothetical protein
MLRWCSVPKGEQLSSAAAGVLLKSRIMRSGNALKIGPRFLARSPESPASARLILLCFLSPAFFLSLSFSLFLCVLFSYRERHTRAGHALAISDRDRLNENGIPDLRGNSGATRSSRDFDLLDSISDLESSLKLGHQRRVVDEGSGRGERLNRGYKRHLDAVSSFQTISLSANGRRISAEFSPQTRSMKHDGQSLSKVIFQRVM